MASEDGSGASPASSSEFFQSSDSEHDNADALRVGSSVANPSKRKLNDALSSPGKRRRFSSPPPCQPSPPSLPSCKGLPPEIWQSIFLNLSPHDLGRLVQVNRAFLLYLTGVVQTPEGHRPSGVSQLRTSDSIWSRSRKMYNPGFPRPLRGLSERDMWALVGSHATRRTCQFCHASAEQTQTTSVWEQGPGAHGVRIVWPFGVRACGTCLEQKSQKETTLLLSSASSLRQGLPFIFLTQDLHVVYPSALSQQPCVPENITLSKYYCTKQVEAIEREFEEARALGSAAAEEWLKGLDARRRDFVHDSERCERWEARELSSAAASSSTPSATPTAHISSKPNSHLRPIPHNAASSTGHFPNSSSAPPQSHSPRVAPSHAVPPQSHTPQSTSAPPRAERTIRDANDAKATRKAEIERRSLELNPPIPPKVLRHIDSFKAATMIAAPLTDQAWDILAPRLEAQREAAEEMERQQAAHAASMQVKTADSKAKDTMDREWEEAQRPIRDRLSQYADEIIRDDWRDGQLVNKEQASKFAASVLMHVRRRYYEEHATAEKNHDENVQEDKEGASLPSKLVLENMKWVFDNKIKHITERYRKELFLCNKCGGNFKFYGFEGVIQHYGAKHTSLFSVGNVIVSWKEAEWPEEPPFHPDPFAARNAYLSTTASVPGQPAFAPYPFGGFSRPTTATPGMSAPGPYPLPQFSPNHFTSPFQPPSYPPGGTIPGYDSHAMLHGAFGPGAPPVGYQASPSYAYASPAQPGMNGPVPLPDGNQHPPGAPFAEQAQARTDMEQRGWESPSKQNLSQRQSKPPDEEQVSFFATAVKAAWSCLTGIKDLSNSVRLYVAFQDAVSSFRSRFGMDPGLDLCAEALSKHPALKLVKTAQGLSCKACRSKLEQQGAPSSAKDNVKLYNSMSLVSHFSQAHLSVVSLSSNQEADSQNLDWKDTMIDLPERRRIEDLLKAPGMDDQKLRILSDVFPDLFPPHLPRLDQANVDSPARKDDPIKSEHGTDSKGTPTQSGKGTRPSSRGTDADSPHYYPGRGENEYDPRRPSLELGQREYIQRRPPGMAVYRVSPQLDERPRQVYYEPSPVYLVQRDPYEDEYARVAHRPQYHELDGSWIEVGPGAFSPDHVSRADRYPYHRVSEYDFQHSPPKDGEQMAIEIDDDGHPSSHLVENQGIETQHPKPQANLARNGSPPPVETEAEKFLNTFLPRKDIEEYHRRVEERDRERQDAWRAKLEAEKAAGDGSAVRPEELQPYEPRPGNGDGRSNQGNLQAPPGSSSAGRSPYAEGEPQHSPGFKDGGYRPVNGSYRRREGPYHPPARYARYRRVLYHHDDPSYHGQRITRAHSRYSRYDEQRRRLHSERLRSRSPPPSRRESTAVDDPYADRIAEAPGPPLATRGPQLSPREPIHYEDRGGYSPEPPYIRYRYAEPPPPTYVDKLGRPIQFVRAVPEPYGPPPPEPPAGYLPQPSPRPRYLTAGPRHIGEPVPVYEPVYEYVPYEGMPPRVSPIHDREYVLYEDPNGRPFEGGRERRGGIPSHDVEMPKGPAA